MLQSKHSCILPQHIVICIRPADDCCSGHLLRVACRKSMVQNPWGAAQAAGRDELQVLISWSSFEEFTESTNSCRWDERGISEPTRPEHAQYATSHTITCLLFTWACSTNYWPHTWACSVYHLGGVATLHLLTPFKACFKCVFSFPW